GPGGFDPGPFTPGPGGFDPGPFTPSPGGFEPIGFQPDTIFDPIFELIFEPIFVEPIFQPIPEEVPLNGAGENLINSPPTLTPFSSLSLSPGGVDAISVFATDPNGDTISVAVTGGSLGTVSANINSGLDEIFSHGAEHFAATLAQTGSTTGAFTAGSQAAQAKALELGITAEEFAQTNTLVESTFLAAIENGASPSEAFAAGAQAAKAFLPDMLFLAVANNFTNQSVTLNVTATDEHGATTIQTLLVSVGTAQETNNAPVAANDILIATENDPGSLFPINVISNDTDIDADTFTVTSFRTGSIEGAGSPINVNTDGVMRFVDAAHGSIGILNNGVVIYDLNNTNTVVNDLRAGEILTETFNYTITDQHGLSDTATLNVNIVGAHDIGADPVVVGYYGLGLQSGNPNQAVSATASGTTTGLDLENVRASDLAAIDILLAQNPSTSADLGGGEFENQASIGNAINSGLVLIFHDQGIGNNEVELTNTIPGLDGVIFTRQVAEDINLSTQAKDSNLSTSIVSSGLAGNLNDNSLDGVNNSRHGFVELASLPNNAIPLLTTNNPDEIVTFVYPQGQGHVIYSSIPINKHMSGNGNSPGVDNIKDIYAPNLVQYAATLVDPIVLDLDGDGFEFIHIDNQSISFSMNPDVSQQPNDWVAPDDGFLVLDKNNNGIVDDIREMFSEFFVDGVNTGVGALSTLDENNDGVINSLDSQFANLKIWQDKNSDGFTDQGELKLLSDFNFAEFKLSIDKNGELFGDSVLLSTGSIKHINGDESIFGEVALSVSSFNAKETNSIDKLNINNLDNNDFVNNEINQKFLKIEEFLEPKILLEKDSILDENQFLNLNNNFDLEIIENNQTHSTLIYLENKNIGDFESFNNIF
ncbi:MAG: hypothetical protein CMM49_02700, partial [Rhodospirillaceae bacterium]|nr:hypothetical protein [Rhodospirillaceae bacterium]